MKVGTIIEWDAFPGLHSVDERVIKVSYHGPLEVVDHVWGTTPYPDHFILCVPGDERHAFVLDADQWPSVWCSPDRIFPHMDMSSLDEAVFTATWWIEELVNRCQS